MSRCFKVQVKEKDGYEHFTICRSREELSNLLLHIDAATYRIVKVEVEQDLLEDYKDFCIKDKNIETGGTLND